MPTTDPNNPATPNSTTTDNTASSSSMPTSPISTEYQDVPPPPPSSSEVPTNGTPIESSATAPAADQTAIPAIESPVVITSGSQKPHKKGPSKTFIATIFGVLLLVGGVASGLILTQQNQEIRERAAGEETTPLIEETDAPVTTPPVVAPPIQCLEIKAYSVTGEDTDPANWEKLTALELTKLKPGDKVYLAIAGKSNSTGANGGFDKAKFKVKTDDTFKDVDSLTFKPKAETDTTQVYEIYTIYTVPQAITTFTISGQIHHTSAGWM